MPWAWISAATIVAVLPSLFGHFEAGAPAWTRIVRWLSYLAVLLGIDVLWGPPWTWAWIAGVPLLGAIFHVFWCARHRINPLTAEPRGRYYELRGWPVDRNPRP